MTKRFFITGTDTEVGKTYVSCELLKHYNNKNLSTVALKPIASGCNDNMQNADALLLQENSSIKLSYDQVNPFAFKEPIAPHIAAQKTGVELSSNNIIESIKPQLNTSSDVIIIEGAGGWDVPLNHQETYSSVVKALDLNVILVVGMKLGCINHAILSAKAILNDDVRLVGWIANCIDPEMSCLNENIDTLKAMLAVPCLGVIKYGNSFSAPIPTFPQRGKEL